MKIKCLHIPIAILLSLNLRGADKLVIESPQSDGQNFTSGRVVIVVKVDSSVKRIIAKVTIPAAKPSTTPAAKGNSAATPAAATPAAAGPQTIFTLGPVDLPRGAERWSPELKLAAGENTITVTDADDDKNSATRKVTADTSDMSSDTRNDFEAGFYAGASIDSFASNETKQYIGYTSADSGPKTGYVAGIDFAYRLFKRNTESRWPVQLWLFGETVHGQRSTEVVCSQTAGTGSSATPPAVCAGFNADNAPDAFLAILRNSSSLEASAGARLEFLKLNRSSNYSANLYLKSQLGFITVQNNGGDVVDDHLKIGLGTILTNGPFKGSYLDAGWGRSDLFAIHRGRRFKVDGYIEWEAKISNQVSIFPFFQMIVDSDFGPGSDDIRTYYGINMEIRTLSCLFNSAGCAKKAAAAAAGANPAQKPAGSN